MKLTTVMTVAAISALAVGCSFMTPRQHPSSRSESGTPVSTHDVTGLVEAGIEAYNNGDIAAAKSSLEAVLQATRDKPMKGTRARAHFYLAALAWDVGDEKKTDEHLRQCRSLQPLFEPDWTFFAPGLRKRYESLKVRVKPATQKPTPQEPPTQKPEPQPPATQRPEPQPPAPQKPEPQPPATQEPARQKPVPEEPATPKLEPEKPTTHEPAASEPAPKS